ncbi:RadC family protein [Sneathiella limimaris]|uniref:RadC family protein n=1 Tax=Sneathiella limimaris TaxID=1964213 RepID=UPI00146E8E3E|nr:DNA repair protein RadC [Sneathiella limimaris]
MTSEDRQYPVSPSKIPDTGIEETPISPSKEILFNFPDETEQSFAVEDSADSKNHKEGHRERLRKKVLNSGAEALADYELLEFLLFSAYPRGDTKPLAKRLIHEFKDLGGVLTASPEKLKKINGVGDTSVAIIKVAEKLGEKILRSRVENRNIIGSWQALLEYCQGTMGRKEIEHFRILFLNNRHFLIADEVQQTGTINQAAVYPREVIKRALELGATSLILVHNHPSGDTSPSRSDIQITEEIVKAAEALQITIHDHLIVSANEYSSMKSMGLL